MKSIEQIALEVAKNFQYEEMDDEFVTLIKVIHEKWLAQQTPAAEVSSFLIFRWLVEPPSNGTLLYLAPPTAIPEGYVLVPAEPTKKMLDAAEKLDWADSDIRGNLCNQWQAMLAAGEKK